MHVIFLMFTVKKHIFSSITPHFGNESLGWSPNQCSTCFQSHFRAINPILSNFEPVKSLIFASKCFRSCLSCKLLLNVFLSPYITLSTLEQRRILNMLFLSCVTSYRIKVPPTILNQWFKFFVMTFVCWESAPPQLVNEIFLIYPRVPPKICILTFCNLSIIVWS